MSIKMTCSACNKVSVLPFDQPKGWKKEKWGCSIKTQTYYKTMKNWKYEMRISKEDAKSYSVKFSWTGTRQGNSGLSGYTRINASTPRHLQYVLLNLTKSFDKIREAHTLIHPKKVC